MAEDPLNTYDLVTSGLIGSLVVAILFLYPLWRSLKRAGFHPAWSLIVLIPYLWFGTIPAIYGILAFGTWPAVAGPPPKTRWRLFGRTDWITVTAEEAAANRYHGLDGWLLALFAVSAAGLFMNLVNLFNPAVTSSLEGLYGLSGSAATANYALSLLISIVYLVLIPIRRPFVPFVMIAATWANLLLFLAFLATNGGFPPLYKWTMPCVAVYIALFSAYWLKSKRVNVTYRHRVPAAAEAGIPE